MVQTWFLRSGDASGAGILPSQCSSVAVNPPVSYLVLEEAMRRRKVLKAGGWKAKKFFNLGHHTFLEEKKSTGLSIKTTIVFFHLI